MKRRAFALLAALPLLAIGQSSPRIIYTKTFKGSTPEYVSITIERSGDSVYKEAVDDERPVKFMLPEADTRQIFELAEKLGYFSRPLEGSAKVANMGMKAFRYEDGAKTGEVKFNYSTDVDARAIQDWFERISETEQDYIELDKTLHFDKLGVNRALALIQISWDKKRLVAPKQFLPLLERITKNDSIVHIARERAASLSDAFRQGGEPAAVTDGATGGSTQP